MHHGRRCEEVYNSMLGASNEHMTTACIVVVQTHGAIREYSLRLIALAVATNKYPVALNIHTGHGLGVRRRDKDLTELWYCYELRACIRNAIVFLTGESFSLPSSPMPVDPAPSPLGSEGPCSSHRPSVVLYSDDDSLTMLSSKSAVNDAG